MCCSSALADPETSLIRKSAEESSAALITGDYGRVCDFTYPKVLETIGGRDKGIETLQSRADAMKLDGVALLAADISEPEEIIASGDKQFAIVPMRISFKSPKGTVRWKGFLIAISADHGRSWTFVDGSELTKEEVAQILPNFPPQLSLPAPQQPVIEPK